MKLYLAGPMTGYPEYNFPAFFAAAADLRARGHEVWSPAENDVSQDGFDPANDKALTHRHYMKRDLPAVLDSDAVACLPGWEKSKGARIEVFVARECGIPILDAADLDELVVFARTSDHTGGVVTRGELERGKRRALNLLDEWVDVTGAITKHSGYHSEVEGLIEDAVEIGVQCAFDVHDLLDAEKWNAGEAKVAK